MKAAICRRCFADVLVRQTAVYLWNEHDPHVHLTSSKLHTQQDMLVVRATLRTLYNFSKTKQMSLCLLPRSAGLPADSKEVKRHDVRLYTDQQQAHADCMQRNAEHAQAPGNAEAATSPTATSAWAEPQAALVPEPARSAGSAKQVDFSKSSSCLLTAQTLPVKRICTFNTLCSAPGAESLIRTCMGVATQSFSTQATCRDARSASPAVSCAVLASLLRIMASTHECCIK